MSLNFWHRSYVIGLKAGTDSYLPMRADMADPLISALRDSMTTNLPELQRVQIISGSMFLRSPVYGKELSSLDPYFGRKDDPVVKRFDDQLYTQFVKEYLPENLFVFKVSELQSSPIHDGDFLQGLLEIFLYDSKKLVLERPKSSVIRLASRPNIVSRFFTSNNTGDTETILFPSEVQEVEVYRDHIQIYLIGGENVGVYKERVYI
jgi:hypothetical protein